MPRLGAHLSIGGGLPRAVDRAVATRCEALQIFTKSAGQWRARPLPPDEVVLFRRRVAETGIQPVVAHNSYLINIAAAAPALREQSQAALEEEYDRAASLDLMGLVMHPGLVHHRHGDRRAPPRSPTGCASCCSAAPGGRRSSCSNTPPDRAPTWGTASSTWRRSSICSTAHPASVSASIPATCSRPATTCAPTTGYARTFEEFDRLVGVDRIRVFHLNDSKKPCGSRVDRHEHIGQGCLGIEPFRRLLNDPRFAGLPMLLETPKQETPESRRTTAADPWDLRNLRTLRRLVARPSALPGAPAAPTRTPGAKTAGTKAASQPQAGRIARDRRNQSGVQSPVPPGRGGAGRQR